MGAGASTEVLGWVVLRHSGTRKTKCYLEVVVPVTTDLAGARSAVTAVLAAVTADVRAVLTCAS